MPSSLQVPFRSGSKLTGQVTVTGLRTVNPARDAVSAARLSDAGRWRAEGLAKLAPAADGLRIDIDASGRTVGLK